MLRFSRLFKPNKSSRLPKVWRNVKIKCKKRRQSDTNDSSFSDNDSKSQILNLEFGSLPEPELIAGDDEVVFHFAIYQSGIFNFFQSMYFAGEIFTTY